MNTYILLLILTSTTVIHARNIDHTTDTKYLNTIMNIAEGISDFSKLIISNFQDIYNLLSSDDVSDVQSNLTISVPEDAYLNVSQLARKYGYPFEEHTVITDDGYILNFHRIPHGKNGERNNIVVFLMHGILDASDSWIIQGPDRAMSYILADYGFDVWMGNSRGNKHAPLHLTLNSSQPEFWEFTWEEIGIYDMTKMIDYILNITGKEDLYYIGHSQGTTSFYAMTSLRPEYNKKIKMMFSLAPVAWMSHVKSPLIKMLSPTSNILGYLLSNFNTYAPSPVSFNKVSAYICSVLNIRCNSYLTLIIGDVYKSLNSTMLPIMLGHMFSGASMLQFIHYGQLVKSKRFCRYDFGSAANLEIYGDSSPPDYNIEKITVPIGLFYSEEDWVSSPIDVSLLKNGLPNVFLYENLGEFNHLDYLYAPDAKEKILSKIINQMLQFEDGEKLKYIEKDVEFVN